MASTTERTTATKSPIWIVVPEEHATFLDEAAAIRHVKKLWAGQSASERTRYALARVQVFLDPDYEVKLVMIDPETGKEVET